MCNLKASQHFSIFQDVSYFVLERSEVVAHFVLHIVYFVHSVIFQDRIGLIGLSRGSRREAI